MPIGANLQIPFDTTATDDRHLYPFVTGGVPTEEPLGTFDAYHGHYGEGELAPAISLDGDAYHGAYSTSDLQITKFLDGDAYHGSYADCDFTDNPVDLFDGDVYHGAYAVTDTIQITPHFSVDAYHGAYADCDFTDNPVDLFDGDAYHGAYADTTFTTTVNIQDVDAYHGAYADCDLLDNPADELDGDAYHGSYGEVDLSTIKHFDVPVYHGSYGEVDLDIFPAAELDADAYHGAYAVQDTFFVTPHFNPDAYHGGYGDTDLTIILGAGFGVVSAYHGSYGDGELAPTFALDAEGYHGAYGEHELATTINFGTNLGYGGEYADCDFTLNPPDEFEPNAQDGGYSTLDSLSTTRALFPRGYHGAYADCDFTDNPVDLLDGDAYHGGYAVVDTLDEDSFIFRVYHGAYAEPDTLSLTQALYPEGYQGAYSVLDTLATTTTFDGDAYGGGNGLITSVGFEVPAGEALEALAYHGATFEAETDIRVHALLKVHFVNDYAMYDGFGGVGGLNHCPSEHLSGTDQDTILRFDFPGNFENYDADVNFYFEETGFRPWNICNSHHNHGYLEVDLLTNPRFDLDVYTGAGTEVYIPKELSSFGNPPDDILYSEDGSGDRHDHQNPPRVQMFELDIETGGAGAVWFDDIPVDPDAFGFATTWHAHSIVDLELFTDIPVYDDIGNGATAEVSFLHVLHPNWFEFIGSGIVGHDVYLDFNPEIWMRFCPGYVLPVGNNVILEFASTDDTDCFGYFANHGQRADTTLSALPHPSPNVYGGEYAIASLLEDTPWLVEAQHGPCVCVNLFTEHFEFFDPINYHGHYISFEFYEPPINGYHGANATLDELIVAGPLVEWVTEEGCLSNDYIPLTGGGDLDLEAMEPDEHGVLTYFPVPVELHIYFKSLLAECRTFVQN